MDENQEENDTALMQSNKFLEAYFRRWHLR